MLMSRLSYRHHLNGVENLPRHGQRCRKRSRQRDSGFEGSRVPYRMLRYRGAESNFLSDRLCPNPYPAVLLT